MTQKHPTMKVDVTPEAARHIKVAFAHSARHRKGRPYLRIVVLKHDTPHPSIAFYRDQEIRHNDSIAISENITILADPIAYAFIKGGTLDWHVHGERANDGILIAKNVAMPATCTRCNITFHSDHASTH